LEDHVRYPRPPSIQELEHELRMQDEELAARAGGEAAFRAFNRADCAHPTERRVPVHGGEFCMECDRPLPVESSTGDLPEDDAAGGDAAMGDVRDAGELADDDLIDF
jgi:hypothetical protein